jgi:hypothetical protein
MTMIAGKSKAAKVSTFSSAAEFLFNAPLYAKFDLGNDGAVAQSLFGLDWKNVDGHCPYCHERTVYSRFRGMWPQGGEWANFSPRKSSRIDSIVLRCARNDDHQIIFYLRIHAGSIFKIGQYPSLADISNDESKLYRGVLNEDDSSEFHKAIGLAAHGVGIGSFVYLRRIFERLIYRRFEEFKTSENWEDGRFAQMRMEEKIDLMRNHLPGFLVTSRKIYSILSLGIHELDEAQCLSFFEILKNSITVILNDDKKKKEELDLRSRLQKSIADFEGKAD